MSDWENSDNEVPVSAKPIAPKIPAKSKWEGEDEDEDGPVSDWEESSSEDDDEKPAPSAPPPKKKGTLKAKLTEKEAEKARRLAEGGDDDADYDSDKVLDHREKARRDKEREVTSDLTNAADLFGAAAHGGTSSSELDWIISCQPRTKEDFQEFSRRLIEYTIKRHQSKPLYASFLEHHVRELAIPLKDVEVRKVASGLTALANEKQKEQRDKASGKKKPKAASKPVLGSTKVASRLDTSVYDEALDDFGSNADDFM